MRTLSTAPDQKWTGARASDDFIRTHSHTARAIDPRLPTAALGGYDRFMRRADVIAQISARREELTKQFGVRSLALFGSVARDEATPDSDVDLLVEFKGPTTFDAHMGLRFQR